MMNAYTEWPQDRYGIPVRPGDLVAVTYPNGACRLESVQSITYITDGKIWITFEWANDVYDIKDLVLESWE